MGMKQSGGVKSNIPVYIELAKSMIGQFISRLEHFRQECEDDADRFGMSPSFMERVRPFFQFLYHDYFRVDAYGADNVPEKGPAILVANHSGTVPYDATMSHLAVYNNLRNERAVRFLVDDFIFNIPILGKVMEKIGGVRASFENAMELLEDGHLVMIFPEGIEGIGKLYDERYNVQEFRRAGFVRLAIKMKVPVIPVSIVGAEEIHPLIWKSEKFAEHFGLPYIPFTPTFPWLGPLGLVPLPSKWKITFNRPISYKKFKPADAKKNSVVLKEAAKVREIISKSLKRDLKNRKSVWE